MDLRKVSLDHARMEWIGRGFLLCEALSSGSEKCCRVSLSVVHICQCWSGRFGTSTGFVGDRPQQSAAALNNLPMPQTICQFNHWQGQEYTLPLLRWTNELSLIYGRFSDQLSEIQNSYLISIFLFRKMARAEAAKPHSFVGRYLNSLVQTVTLTGVEYTRILTG